MSQCPGTDHVTTSGLDPDSSGLDPDNLDLDTVTRPLRHSDPPPLWHPNINSPHLTTDSDAFLRPSRHSGLDPVTLHQADLEPSDSVGSDSFLLKLGGEEYDIDDELEKSSDSSDQQCSGPDLEPPRRSKRSRTCHVFLAVFSVVVVVFVVVAIAIGLVFTLGDRREVSGEPIVAEVVHPDSTVVTKVVTSTTTTTEAPHEHVTVTLSGLGKDCVNVMRGEGKSGVYSFMGIRYAQPPTGSLRWKPPLPLPDSVCQKPPSNNYNDTMQSATSNKEQPAEQQQQPGEQQSATRQKVARKQRATEQQPAGQQQQQQPGGQQQQAAGQQPAGQPVQHLQIPEGLSVPRCVQLEDGELAGQEDCLYLNVWTPSLSSLSGLDVLVYIHGGRLMTGSGLDIGSHLVSSLVKERQVVLVTLNYRLNVFGFLTLKILSQNSQQGGGPLGDSAGGTSGNYGLMDQVQALKWVQQNIREFGGDPNKVTVIGQGSGATSLYALLGSDSVHGLFSRAWLASPSPNLESTREEAEIKNLEFLNRTSCTSPPSSSQYSCLIGLSTEGVVKALPWKRWLNEHFYEMPQSKETSHPLIVIDGSVLKSSPIEMMLEKNFNDVPLLIGSTAQETDIKSTIEHRMSAWQYSDYLRQILAPFSYINIDEVLSLYPPPLSSPLVGWAPENISQAPSSTEEAISTIVSDIRVICTTDEMAKVAASVTKFGIFRYVATYKSSSSSEKQKNTEKSENSDEFRYINQDDDARGDVPDGLKTGADNDDELLRKKGQVEEIPIRTVNDNYDEEVVIEPNISPDEDVNDVVEASHNYAYSGIDMDAFFGIDRHADASGASSASFRTFSKQMRDIVFEFVKTGRVGASRPFPAASLEISAEIKETEPRFKSERCDYWRRKSFYPRFTWIN